MFGRFYPERPNWLSGTLVPTVLSDVVHFAKVIHGFRRQHFAYPSAMFNHRPQCPGLVEHPGVPMYSRVTNSVYSATGFEGFDVSSAERFLQAQLLQHWVADMPMHSTGILW